MRDQGQGAIAMEDDQELQQALAIDARLRELVARSYAETRDDRADLDRARAAQREALRFADDYFSQQGRTFFHQADVSATGELLREALETASAMLHEGVGLEPEAWQRIAQLVRELAEQAGWIEAERDEIREWSQERDDDDADEPIDPRGGS